MGYQNLTQGVYRSLVVERMSERGVRADRNLSRHAEDLIREGYYYGVGPTDVALQIIDDDKLAEQTLEDIANFEDA